MRSRDAEDIRRRFAENAFVTDSGVHVRFLFLGVTSALEGWLPSMVYTSREGTGGPTGCSKVEGVRGSEQVAANADVERITKGD